MYVHKELPTNFGEAMNLRALKRLDTPVPDLERLILAAQSGILDILWAEMGRPIGYIACANISKETLRLILRGGHAPKYPYEWNEGGILLIYEVVLLAEWNLFARRQLIEKIRRSRAVVFARRGRMRVYVRRRNRIFMRYKPAR